MNEDNQEPLIKKLQQAYKKQSLSAVPSQQWQKKVMAQIHEGPSPTMANDFELDIFFWRFASFATIAILLMTVYGFAYGFGPENNWLISFSPLEDIWLTYIW